MAETTDYQFSKPQLSSLPISSHHELNRNTFSHTCSPEFLILCRDEPDSKSIHLSELLDRTAILKLQCFMLDFTFFTTGKNSLFSETGSHHLTLAGLGFNYVDEAGSYSTFFF